MHVHDYEPQAKTGTHPPGETSDESSSEHATVGERGEQARPEETPPAQESTHTEDRPRPGEEQTPHEPPGEPQAKTGMHSPGEASGESPSEYATVGERGEQARPEETLPGKESAHTEDEPPRQAVPGEEPARQELPGQVPPEKDWSGVDNFSDFSYSSPEPAEPRWSVFLRNPSTATYDNDVHPLARILGLDVYGKSLLSRRAAVEMGFVAAVLAVIFIFDLLAWSLLFNGVLHGSANKVDALTLLAILGGTLFAFAILTYERQFVAADTSAGWRKLLLPMGLRLFVIAASAVITAQPIELLFFRGPIMNHTHQELVREHAVGLLIDLQKLDELGIEAQVIPDAVQAGPEYERVTELEDKIANREGAVEGLEDQLQELQRNLRDWVWAKDHWNREKRQTKSRLNELRASGANPDELSATEAALKNAEKQYDRASRESSNYSVLTRNAEEDLALEKERLDKLYKQRDGTYKRYREVVGQQVQTISTRVSSIESQKGQLHRWFQELLAAEPGTSLEPCRIGDVVYQFTPRSYDFFEQLRVLSDLRHARLPRWPGSTTAEIQNIAGRLGIRDMKSCELPSGTEDACTLAEKQMWLGFKERARLFDWSWKIIYAIAVIIPCLVIAIKLLLPAELKAYYSSRHQAAAGNAEAIGLVTVRQVVKERTRGAAP